MTEEEIVRMLSEIDRPTVESANSAGPFSVFQLQSLQPHQNVSNLQGERLQDNLNMMLHETANCDQLHPQGRNNETFSSKSCQSDVTNHNTEPTDMPPDGSSDVCCREQSMIGRSFIRPESDIEESHFDNMIRTLKTSSAGGIHYLNDSLETYERDNVQQASLLSFNHQSEATSVAEQDSTNVQAVSFACEPSPHQSNPLPIAEAYIPNMALKTLCQSIYVSLVGSPLADKLVHHYMKHTVHIMQPVSHKENPFQTTYFPLAVAGSSELANGRDSNHVLSAKVAIFHLLLSIAATNLRDCWAENEELRELAYHHKQLALIALRKALTTKSSKYRDLMVAILFLVSADVSLRKSFS